MKKSNRRWQAWLCGLAITSISATTMAGTPPPPAAEATPTTVQVKWTGHVASFYAYSFNRPSNGAINNRIFDNRHNALAVSGASLGAEIQRTSSYAKIALWWGLTPATIYAGEPDVAAGVGVGPSNTEMWRLVKEANAGWTVAGGAGLQVSAGLFPSPFGFEGATVRDNWNWSSSNLNFALPFYLAGARVSYPVGHGVSLTAGIYNGFGSLLDRNGEKSVALQLGGEEGTLQWGTCYYAGVERATSAPEGQPILHTLDAWASLALGGGLALAAQGDVGFEENDLGTSWWAAAAVYVRKRLNDSMALTVRADWMRDHASKKGTATAGRYFLPVEAVVSGTATLDYSPVEELSVRFEVRHDRASAPLYHDSDSGVAPGANAQTNLTVGLVTGF